MLLFLEPTESPQGNPSYSSVWREDSGLHSRPGRKRRPSAREDGGVSGVGCLEGTKNSFVELVPRGWVVRVAVGRGLGR